MASESVRDVTSAKQQAWTYAVFALIVSSVLVPRARAQDAAPSPTPAPEVVLETTVENTTPVVVEEDPASQDGEPTGYRELVSQALDEYTAKNFEESRALFLRAHALFPNARTLRGLGMVEFERRNYLASIDYLEQALSSAEKPLDHALRAETEALLARAKTFVGSVEIVVTPETARVSIDGAPHTGNEARVLLQVGEHSFEIHADGYIAQRRTLSIRGAESQRLTIRLEPLEAPVAQAQRSQTEKKGWLKSPWLWIGTGVVLAGVGTGMAIALRPEAKEKVAEPQMTDHSTGVVLQALGHKP